MPRFILIAVLFTSPFAAHAESSGYGVAGNDVISEAMLSEACSDWKAETPSAMYSKVNKKCHALTGMKSFECYEDASQCLSQAMDCMSKALNPGLECFFNTYTSLQRNVHVSDLNVPTPSISGSTSDAAGR